MIRFVLKTLTVVFLFVFISYSYTADAQDRGNSSPRVSPNAAVSQTIGTTNIFITYGRPGVRDRTIFGDLVPFGDVWRTGANESTNITFADDVLFAGELVEAGTYSMYTIPEEDTWTIILNNEISWGTRYTETEDLLRIEADSEESHFLEQMMIYFENVTEESGDLVLHWDRTKVSVTIEEIREEE